MPSVKVGDKLSPVHRHFWHWLSRVGQSAI